MTSLFCLSLFVNSMALFWLEPMFGKMILPYFGGTPAVWNACMLFYQSALLAGYALAHALARRLEPRRQILIHGALFAAAAAVLPVAVDARWLPARGSAPVASLLLLLLVSVGPPLLALSVNGILLQSWFSRTGVPGAEDPYFLYQASNLGSLVALLGYPVAVEPLLRLTQQGRLWSALYAATFALTLVCAAGLRPSTSAARRTRAAGPAAPIRPMRWLALAFVPSSLLLGVTTHLTTAISPVPLLWIVPLALYLATFAVAFGRRRWIPRGWMLWLQPMVLLPVLFLMAIGAARPVWAVASLHLGLLFVTAMLCHTELADARPAAEHLTGFYLWIALGGALGGVFNAIIGPMAFDTVAEYPVTIALACMIRPVGARAGRLRWNDLGWPALVGALAIGLSASSHFWRLDIRPLFALPVLLCLALKDRPLRFGLGASAVLLLSLPYSPETGRPIHVERSFFGVHRVLVDAQNRYHWLTHGGIVHGIQSLSPESAARPLGYYHETGPLGELFKALGPSLGGKPVAVVGLGIGATACYGKPGQSWTYYELDPAVNRLAHDPRYFSMLEKCPVEPRVVLGDARLSLSKAKDGAYRWIILDAFSSDAIPTHLLTREALRLYLSKLDERGLLLYDVSNGYLDIAPVLGDLARAEGLAAFVQDDPADERERADGQFPSTWVVMARRGQDLAALAGLPQWRPLAAPGKRLWTDDFSDVLYAMRWR